MSERERLPASHYEPQGGDRFQSTPLTRGPWSPDHQHGGPPFALLARTIERKLAEVADARVARLHMSFAKAVPITATLTARAEVIRAGKKSQEIVATLSSGDDVLVRASALCVRRTTPFAPAGPPAGPAADAPRPPAECEPYEFGFFTHEVGYHRSQELRFARGTWGSGACAIWFRPSAPLLPGEALTPLQRVALVVDSGNGVGFPQDLVPRRFLNADTDVALLRPLEGEWVCLDATTRAGPEGAGLVDVALFDERGPLGRATQCLVVE